MKCILDALDPYNSKDYPTRAFSALPNVKFGSSIRTGSILDDELAHRIDIHVLTGEWDARFAPTSSQRDGLDDWLAARVLAEFGNGANGKGATLSERPSMGDMFAKPLLALSAAWDGSQPYAYVQKPDPR